ncbi:TonB family protein [Dysgonomonas termitidis]|uniref:TonB family protein n=1 Tax=Dysgonomonas termitidis TaxID=1516126 RepID=A0ABV9L271_9BACT
MDNTILIYLIKVSVALALFYGLYMLCLKRDTFFKLRRAYFFSAILFSLFFPVIAIEMPASSNTSVQIPTYWLSDIEVGSAVDAETSMEATMGIWSVVLVILAAVSAFYAVKFIIQLFSLVKLRVANETERLSTYRIIKMKDRRTSPFSFFNWIFINSDAHNPFELAEIIAHEQVHVNQYHSIDVVLSEILCICFWWNPFAWLLKKEIKLNLEYLADKGVLESGVDSKEYQYILLQVSNRSTGIPLINNFNVSQLKRRITMMNKKKSSIFTSIKYLLVIPVGTALLLGNAVQATTSLDNFSIDGITEVMDGNQAPQKKGDVYVTVEQMPSFPGGLDAQQRFIADGLKYPVEAQAKGIQGRVTIRYVIKSTGEISDIEVIRGVDPLLDKEAIRIVKSMPKWEPGKQGGKAVDVYYTLPIVFRLAGGNTDKVKSGGKPNEIVVVGYGAAPEKEVGVASLKEGSPNDKMMPFITVEQMPSFPGGEQAMHEFISNNLKYPESAQKNGIQGRVTVRFIVRSTGEISDVSVIRGIEPDMDKEAARTVRSMPKWTPGKQNGQAVDVYFTLPIVYKLKKDEKK